MTIKDIARAYAQSELQDSHAAVEDVVAGAFEDGVEYARTHPQWISIKDKPVPKNQWLLTYAPEFKDYPIDTEYMDGDDDAKDFGITHWMPLPKAPKEGGEE